jgi:3-phosphoshikimate 1-carboxyvinyltransferase
MNVLRIKPWPVIDGTIRVPGDKSISHRSVMLGSLAEGTTRVTGFLPGEDCMCTLRAFQSLGVHIDVIDDTTLVIEGCGGKLQAVEEAIDCGNSGTSMRLMSGVLAAQPFISRLFGDPSLSSRPMKRVSDPLGQMGAIIEGTGDKKLPPLTIHGTSLTGIDYNPPMVSAQVKSAVLLAGLFAKGRTSVTEAGQSRDHTERMLEHFFAKPLVEKEYKLVLPAHLELPDGADPEKFKLKVVVSNRVIVHGGTKLHANDLQVPGDISSAAFWIVAAAVHPDSHLIVHDVGLNPTRTGLIQVLLRMHASIRENIEGRHAEPIGTIRVQGGRLRGTKICGHEIPNVIDELPILSVAAALAEGVTEISDAGELRVKETDRIEAMATNLRAFGVNVTTKEDGMIIEGGGPIRAARVPSYGDHRIAMASAILALFADGESEIEDVDCIRTSYPTFEDDLKKLTPQSSLEMKRIVSFLPWQKPRPVNTPAPSSPNS